jgi:hypothetical protein
MRGFARINNSKAILHGLTFRPIERIAADTLGWASGRADDYELLAGLKPDRERTLLEEWTARV